MTKEEIITKILALVKADDGIEGDNVTPTMSFKNDLNLDSLDVFELVNEIEDEFEIEIDTDETIDTIDDLATYVQGKLAAKTQA
ncbi:acyl carrier protein [Lacticaseibacillus pantheris]|jgi:acyl carrier protein|uniref:Acyl carrier protein n=1 Tax=Lacticaseibacillus pantheris DSM 15945 = JCM 12539 = NBRC 106106 TaxID=1423783 RepID=A0A0R1U045_9LACO|nr:acyl carrier protein [Lacticaseibacillus pantheris]KRL84504.1 hypothetical protein FC50_GL002115 [Lacticaseibacillus pantheris DSM 15945 = JCM 12539 = NBRC 106106]WKF84905.1 acyl carrier protein [Lacticaseibacillus pantheris]